MIRSWVLWILAATLGAWFVANLLSSVHSVLGILAWLALIAVLVLWVPPVGILLRKRAVRRHGGDKESARIASRLRSRWPRIADSAGISRTDSRQVTRTDKEGHMRQETRTRTYRPPMSRVDPHPLGLHFQVEALHRLGQTPADIVAAAPALAAAAGVPLEVSAISPRLVDVVVVLRDPLAAASTHALADSAPAAQGVTLDDWLTD